MLARPWASRTCPFACFWTSARLKRRGSRSSRLPAAGFVGLRARVASHRFQPASTGGARTRGRSSVREGAPRTSHGRRLLGPRRQQRSVRRALPASACRGRSVALRVGSENRSSYVTPSERNVSMFLGGHGFALVAQHAE